MIVVDDVPRHVDYANEEKPRHSEFMKKCEK